MHANAGANAGMHAGCIRGLSCSDLTGFSRIDGPASSQFADLRQNSSKRMTENMLAIMTHQ